MPSQAVGLHRDLRAAVLAYGAEDVRPVALVMHTAGDLCPRVVQFLDLAKEINCRSPDWRQKASKRRLIILSAPPDRYFCQEFTSWLAACVQQRRHSL
jgi:hypothetical protein